MAQYAAERTMAMGQLMAARTWAAEPAKSSAIASPSTVTVTAMGSGSGSSPTPSIQSVNR